MLYYNSERNYDPIFPQVRTITDDPTIRSSKYQYTHEDSVFICFPTVIANLVNTCTRNALIHQLPLQKNRRSPHQQLQNYTRDGFSQAPHAILSFHGCDSYFKVSCCRSRHSIRSRAILSFHAWDRYFKFSCCRSRHSILSLIHISEPTRPY